VRDARGSALIDERACREAIQPEGGGELIGFVASQEVRKGAASAGYRLEASRPPTGAELEPLDGGAIDDGASIRRDVDGATPVP
jgi:hypothetical protein